MKTSFLAIDFKTQRKYICKGTPYFSPLELLFSPTVSVEN